MRAPRCASCPARRASARARAAGRAARAAAHAGGRGVSNRGVERALGPPVRTKQNKPQMRMGTSRM
eukprot:scaffold181903_cov30-Tisochrysis_lutea.AAC.2